jgi:D-alanine-D-alanine ligase-like ATP-grasp enzyme
VRKPRRTPLWVATRATNRTLLVKAYGRAYLSEYRELVARFDRRPKTVLNDIWTSAAAEVGAAVSGDWDSGFTFRRREQQARVDGWETHLDPPETIERALDKPLAVARLAEIGVAVPEQIAFSRREVGHVAEHIRRNGGVWVLKPRSGDSGAGVTCDIESSADFTRAFVTAATLDSALVLERQVAGSVYRLLILDGELLDVVQRNPSAVEGDGKSTVRDLIRAENHARVDAEGSRGNQLVHPDHDCLLALRAQQMTLASIPPAGARQRVKRSNGDGGRLDTYSVPLASVSPDVVEQATRAVAAMGLTLAGVDVVTPDPRKGLADAGGAIIEVNSPPGLHHHYLTANPDESRHVAARVLERLLDPRSGAARRAHGAKHLPHLSEQFRIEKSE